jgi:hypothetical protein
MPSTGRLCLFCAANAIEGSVSKVVSGASCTDKSGVAGTFVACLCENCWRVHPPDEECVQGSHVFPTPVIGCFAASFPSWSLLTCVPLAEKVRAVSLTEAQIVAMAMIYAVGDDRLAGAVRGE